MHAVDAGPAWRSIAVLGLDAVGAAWVAAAARGGVSVTAFEPDHARLDAGRRRLQEPHPAARSDSILFTTDPGQPPAADLIVDALPSPLAGRREVLEHVARLSRPGTVIAGTGSIRPPGAEVTSRRTITAHLSDPRRPDGVLEVVSTPDTREQIAELADRLGWGVVHLAARPGLIADALLFGYRNSAARMCQDGYATAADIDAAMVLGCGLPVGPLTELDHIGPAWARDVLAELHALTGDTAFAPAAILDERAGTGTPLVVAATAAATAAPAGPPIQKVGIVGTGTMATGIADACVSAGFPVLLIGRSAARAATARAAVKASLDRRVRKGRLSAEESGRISGRLTVGADLGELASCDLVLESIVEDLPEKRRLIVTLDSVCDRDAVFATTTSSLSVTACADDSAYPERVLGLHFFNPAAVMRLVEVVRTRHTAPGVLTTAHAFCAAIGKHSVPCDDRAGFIANALLLPYLNRAADLVWCGYATAAEIDAVVERGCGYPMGPFRVMDMVGLDVIEPALRTLHDAFADPSTAPSLAITELIAAGRLGRKTRHGFHRYDPSPTR
jgi:3-hydroxybutyryl-CoA dehydrogenase